MEDRTVFLPYGVSGGSNATYVVGADTSGVGDNVLPSSITLRVFKCDDDYYLTRYTNNVDTRYQLATNVRSSSSTRLSTVDSIAWLKSHNMMSDDVYFNSSWTSYYIAYKLDLIASTLTATGSSSSEYGYFYIDSLNPIYSDQPILSSCSSLTVLSTSNSVSNTRFIPKFTYSVSSGSDDSGSGGSTDISPLVPAILMIPATIIVVCFFSVIYKMFMNRKVRG